MTSAVVHNGQLSVRIVGTGSYLPEQVLTNADVERRMDTSDEWIRSTYGIRERRIAAEDQNISDLSTAAARNALAAANVDPAELDLIVHASINSDVRSPATACIVQGQLGAHNAVAFDMNLGGCPNAVFALVTAIKYLDGRQFSRALVICTEIYSKFIDWSYRSTSCFLGDGSGAVILEVGEHSTAPAYRLHTDGSQYQTAMWPGGGTATSTEPHTPMIDGRAVWDFGHQVVPEVILDVVDQAGLPLDGVDFFVFHQANINMIRNNMAKLGIEMERTHINNDRYGNTGGASPLIALDEAVRTGKLTPDSRLMVCSYGAGLAWGALLIEYGGQ